MVAEREIPLMSIDEYLAMERESEVRHEYIDGHICLMSGGTPNHGVLITNIIGLTQPKLRGGPCRVYPSDVRVRVGAPSGSERYLYPDCSVSCDEADRTRIDAIHAPRLIVEVLSPSTEAYDRGRKFEFYRSLPSMREYVLVTADRPVVEVYRRDGDADWILRTYGPAAEIALTSIPVRWPVSEIYADSDVAP